MRNGLLRQVNIAVMPCILQNEIYLHGEKLLMQNIKERERVHLMVSQIFQQLADKYKAVIHGIDQGL